MSHNFILCMDNVFTDEFCDAAVSKFKTSIDMGFGLTAQQFDNKPKVLKDNIDLAFEPSIDSKQLQSIHTEFNNVFWSDVYPAYSEEYSILQHGADSHAIYGNKIKHTPIGGGFHHWHFEQFSRETSARILAYIVYLNDVEEGGETEFLYQHMRVKPKKGSIVLFPAAFTHTHRGNPPLSNDKYIMTGWVEY